MHRDAAATETLRRLRGALAEAGMSLADLKEPIDDALRALGYPEGELATADEPNARGFLAMVRYHALKAVLDSLAGNMDISTGDQSYRLNQVFANVEKLLGQSRAEVIGIYGTMDPAGVADSSFVVLNLNSLGGYG